MKNVNQKFLGLLIAISVPETAEEYDKLAGETGACVEDACRQVILHDYGTKWRNKFAEAVEERTKIAWPLNEEATAKGTPRKKDGKLPEVHITPADYFKIVLASENPETGEQYKLSDFTELAQSVAGKLAFDPAESEGGGGRTAKKYLEMASALLLDTARLENALKVIRERNPDIVIEVGENGLPTQDELARAISVEKRRAEREAMAAFV